MNAKELVGIVLVGTSSLAVGCVITTERPADSSPPPAAPTAVATTAPTAPASSPAPMTELAPTVSTAESTADAAAPSPETTAAAPAVPQKHPHRPQKAGEAGTTPTDGGT